MLLPIQIEFVKNPAKFYRNRSQILPPCLFFFVKKICTPVFLRQNLIGSSVVTDFCTVVTDFCNFVIQD